MTISKVIEYVSSTRPSVDTEWGPPMPESLKVYRNKIYYESEKLLSKSILSEDRLTSTTILFFNSEEDLYKYNTDPVLADWRKERNRHALIHGITTIQYAGAHAFSENELDLINSL